jgi:hypothetical protein
VSDSSIHHKEKIFEDYFKYQIQKPEGMNLEEILLKINNDLMDKRDIKVLNFVKEKISIRFVNEKNNK